VAPAIMGDHAIAMLPRQPVATRLLPARYQ